MRAQVRVDLGDIERNRRRLASVPGPRLCAVVEADGYGHGGSPVARRACAALRGGAVRLAVADAAALRGDGVRNPISRCRARSRGAGRAHRPAG